MGGKSGGGGQQQPQIKMSSFDANPESYRDIGVGYKRSRFDNPFTPEGRPAWMQGHFANPQWGMTADGSRAMTQADLQPAMWSNRNIAAGSQAPQAQAPAPAGKAAQMTPEMIAQLLAQQQQQRVPYDNNQGS